MPNQRHKCPHSTILDYFQKLPYVVRTVPQTTFVAANRRETRPLNKD